jgi:hypothetical protein
MNVQAPDRVHAGVWCALGILLLAWNCLLASLASPFVLIHRYDGVQYQLLARNRLLGHDEINERTHTVGTEGRHPMWRPGLVWIEEELARCLGSVRAGAAAASALGTTCLQLALLWLAWCCFGRKTWVFLVIGLPAPAVISPFLTLAVGQGPEVWAAACITAGLAALVIGIERPSWAWALSAGILAGAAEWFRTGNLLLFAVPCAVYGIAILSQHDFRRFALPAGALVTFVGMAALGDRTVPSSVNKTVANLGAWAIESQGPVVTGMPQDGTTATFSMADYTLVPGTADTSIDSIIYGSRGRSTLAYVREHAGEIAPAYLQNLKQAINAGFSGLRVRIGGLILALFGLQMLLELLRFGCSRMTGERAILRRTTSATPREPALSHTFALAGGALAHYLGPVMLLTGDQPTHYLYVALPLFLVLAGRGAHGLIDLIHTLCNRGHSPVARAQQTPWAFIAAALVIIVGLSVPFYRSALRLLIGYQRQALQEQVAVNALGLDRKKVACRNMAWFVDQKVHTLLLPYATVAGLEKYVRAHGIDGILVWEKEPEPYFYATPYGSGAEFAQALQRSALFAAPQVSGSWRWYPVRRTSSAMTQARSSEAALPGPREE